MSKLDIINAEIATRQAAVESLRQGDVDLKVAIEQFNKLDEFYRDQEKGSRELLECIYKENRHFTGEWPIVYTFAQTELYPYSDPVDDAKCNPYFPTSKIVDGTFDGLSPLIAAPTRTGAYQRQRTYSSTEDIPRVPALTELQNFPDISNEPLPSNFPAAQEEITTPAHCVPTATPDTQAQCAIEGGVWVPESTVLVPDPVWNGPDTAPALLRTALNAWRADIVAIQADLCNETSGDENAFWQAIVDDIDIVLPAVATDAVFVRNDPNPDPATWGQTQPFTGAIEAARARLETAADTGVINHVTARKAKLNGNANTEETAFFGIIKLRLHQINGSYSKVESAKKQTSTYKAIIADHEAAIASLNLMKVKNS